MPYGWRINHIVGIIWGAHGCMGGAPYQRASVIYGLSILTAGLIQDSLQIRNDISGF
ncbi:hypothetical protein ACFLU2_01715 [Chloroflexota bacterium]